MCRSQWTLGTRGESFYTAQTISFPLAGMPEESKELIEAELLRKIASGDQAAFAEFYDRFSGVMFSLAINILQDPKEAEDVLQDVFWQIWERASSFDARLGK